MEGFHGPMLCGGRGLSPVASTPDSSAADRAKEEKAPCEVLAMPCFPDAENWDMAHEGKVGCVVRSYASHKWKRSFSHSVYSLQPRTRAKRGEQAVFEAAVPAG